MPHSTKELIICRQQVFLLVLIVMWDKYCIVHDDFYT